MEEKQYHYDPEEDFGLISDHFTEWADKTRAKNFVIGMSGGKDSTVVAMLLIKLFGRDRVVAVSIPNGSSEEKTDGEVISEILGLKCMVVDIHDAFLSLLDMISYNKFNGKDIKVTNDCIINLPPRLRMSVLFAVGQCVDGRVVNTSNLSEDTVGYATQFGDNAGAYAPIQDLTVSEVQQLGMYLAKELGIDEDVIRPWVFKVPADGLQEQSDEDRLGFKYADLDNLIRNNIGITEEFVDDIFKRYKRNKFKTDIVKMPKPVRPFNSKLPNFVKYPNDGYVH